MRRRIPVEPALACVHLAILGAGALVIAGAAGVLLYCAVIAR
jgi:hypothetical protein